MQQIIALLVKPASLSEDQICGFSQTNTWQTHRYACRISSLDKKSIYKKITFISKSISKTNPRSSESKENLCSFVKVFSFQPKKRCPVVIFCVWFVWPQTVQQSLNRSIFVESSVSAQGRWNFFFFLGGGPPPPQCTFQSRVAKSKN